MSMLEESSSIPIFLQFAYVIYSWSVAEVKGAGLESAAHQVAV